MKNEYLSTTYKGLDITISYDQFNENPFGDWDGLPELMFESGRNEHKNDRIIKHIQDRYTYNFIKYHQKKIADILEIEIDDLCIDDKVYEISDAIERAHVGQLGELCQLAKIPYLQQSSTGYSQGDHADVLLVITPEFWKVTGCKKKQTDDILDSAKSLFDAWAWGDVFIIQCEDEDGNDIFCCGGYYGDADVVKAIETEVKPEIDKYFADRKKAYTNKVKDLIANRVPLETRERE